VLLVPGRRVNGGPCYSISVEEEGREGWFQHGSGDNLVHPWEFSDRNEKLVMQKRRGEPHSGVLEWTGAGSGIPVRVGCTLAWGHLFSGG
jgi:hypothetical protein